MIRLLLLGAATVSPNADLVNLAAIVEPYARCRFERRDEVKTLQDQWSVFAHRQTADPADKASAAQADRYMERLRALDKSIDADCHGDEIHQRLRDSLKAINPRADDSRIYWLERAVFNELNNLNGEIVKLRARVPLPPMYPPPIIPRAPR